MVFTAVNKVFLSFRNNYALPLYLIGLIGALITMGSCATYPTSNTSKINSIRTIILNGTDTIVESYFDGFRTWKCRDFVNGGPILVEVGNFIDADMEGIGFILFDGGNKGVEAAYHRSGLDHRWDWDLDESDNLYNYSFVIKSDGTGLYYDFSSTQGGETKKAKDVFVCRQ